jgi:hypothetical protein
MKDGELANMTFQCSGAVGELGGCWRQIGDMVIVDTPNGSLSAPLRGKQPTAVALALVEKLQGRQREQRAKRNGGSRCRRGRSSNQA